MDVQRLKTYLMRGRANLVARRGEVDEQIESLRGERQHIDDDIKRQEGGILACDELLRAQQKEAPPDDDASEEADDDD